MRRIVTTLHRAADLSRTMDAMRVWLDEHRCEPSKFTCDRSPGWFAIRVDFERDDHAEAFKKKFGGADQRAMPQTIAKACWWRLMAEEIRTEADGFSSASAKATMFFAAKTLDQMAKDLEQRLERE